MSALFVPTDYPLNDIPLTIFVLVEVWISLLVLPSGDDSTDSSPTQPAPDPGITIAFISRQTSRPTTTTTPPPQIHATHRCLERSALVALARRHMDTHDGTQTVAQQVDLGGKTATGVAQRMILWLFNFRRHTFVQTRTMMVMVASATCGTSRTDNGTVDAPQIMVEASLIVLLIQQGRQNAGPGAILSPAFEADIDSIPFTIGFGEIAPRRPVWRIHRIPLTMVRWGNQGLPALPWWRGSGRKGSRWANWESDNSWRCMGSLLWETPQLRSWV